MINPSEFKDGELLNALTRLRTLNRDTKALKEQLNKYFNEFDDDNNQYLDPKELRLFLTSFFNQYRIHAPITDEFVDATFREIDSNHDGKIQPEELNAFAKPFIKKLIVQFENARELQLSKTQPVEHNQNGEWVTKVHQLKTQIEMQQKKSKSFKQTVNQYMATAKPYERNECNQLLASCQLLTQSIEKQRAELGRIQKKIVQKNQKTKVTLKLNSFVWHKVDAAFKKFDTNNDGELSFEEARGFILEYCKFEYGKDVTETEVKTTFDLIDTNKDGALSRLELHNALNNMYFPAKIFGV